MTCVPAPACKAMLAEATRLWPKRSKASDGICPSAAHTKRNPTSDHERGLAVDLTDDPDHGCAAHVLAEQVRLRRDIRVKYIISRSRIASASPVAGFPAWAWRPYSGSNPHVSHAHFSIHANARGDTSPWFATATPPTSRPNTTSPTEAYGMKLTTHYHDIVAGPAGAPGLDVNGWGTLIVPVAWERVVSVTGQALGSYPPAAVVCVAGPEGTHTKIQVHGASRQATGVWVKTLDA